MSRNLFIKLALSSLVAASDAGSSTRAPARRKERTLLQRGWGGTLRDTESSPVPRLVARHGGSQIADDGEDRGEQETRARESRRDMGGKAMAAEASCLLLPLAQESQVCRLLPSPPSSLPAQTTDGTSRREMDAHRAGWEEEAVTCGCSSEKRKQKSSQVDPWGMDISVLYTESGRGCWGQAAEKQSTSADALVVRAWKVGESEQSAGGSDSEVPPAQIYVQANTPVAIRV
eukprot:752150-Hanusia_phi.AAC.3